MIRLLAIAMICVGLMGLVGLGGCTMPEAPELVNLVDDQGNAYSRASIGTRTVRSSVTARTSNGVG